MSKCPRQDMSWIGAEHHHSWRPDGTCSFCGSISPDDLFAAIEAGEEITPTDKPYKIYVGGSRKFYFQHLSHDEQDRFIDLYNARSVKMAYPGYFYVLPYFCGRVTSS